MTLTEQIKTARRELSKRKHFYPKWVAAGKMTPADARRKIEAMDAIVATLGKLEAAETARKNPELPLP
jgi:cbb3-type cytochrome oxidase cytochrome c subunit